MSDMSKACVGNGGGKLYIFYRLLARLSNSDIYYEKQQRSEKLNQ